MSNATLLDAGPVLALGVLFFLLNGHGASDWSSVFGAALSVGLIGAAIPYGRDLGAAFSVHAGPARISALSLRALFIIGLGAVVGSPWLPGATGLATLMGLIVGTKWASGEHRAASAESGAAPAVAIGDVADRELVWRRLPGPGWLADDRYVLEANAELVGMLSAGESIARGRTLDGEWVFEGTQPLIGGGGYSVHTLAPDESRVRLGKFTYETRVLTLGTGEEYAWRYSGADASWEAHPGEPGRGLLVSFLSPPGPSWHGWRSVDAGRDIAVHLSPESRGLAHLAVLVLLGRYLILEDDRGD